VSQLTVISPWGPAAASHRVRVLQWLRHLEVDYNLVDYAGTRVNSPRVLVRAPLRALRAERRLRSSGLIREGTLFMHREASPLSRGKLEEALLRRAGRSVYDFDDALQWDYKGSLLRRYFGKPTKCIAAVRSADVVIAGSHMLGEWAAQWASEVVVIPSCVEPADYEVKKSYRIDGPPRLLWMGTPMMEGQIQVAARALLEVSRRTGAVLRLVSSGDRDVGSLAPIVDRVEWSPAVAQAAVAEADIGIAPLVDGLYESGKCAYKILQYAAAGIPVVGSPVGANRSVLNLLGAPAATDTDSWVDGLMSWLERSPEERAAAGTRARAAVEQHYSYAAWSSTWRSTVGV
jgi:glycosyltransferase involved in cell wall biosynthesis